MSNTNSTKIGSASVPLDARKRLESASTIHLFHWMIVLGSLVLTFFAWNYSKTEKDARVEVQFDREAERVIELVRERMEKYEDALWGGVALIHTSGGDIDYDHWERYADSIHIQEKYPGIGGLGVIHSVAQDELAGYLATQRARRPEYKIHPRHAGDEYMPITYIIPAADNARAVGLDMAHEANRFTASKKARDTGKSQITGPITLVQDSGKTPGFLFFAPFYNGGFFDSVEDRQNRFTGMVYAPFVVKKLMEGTLDKNKRQVGIRIFDGEDLLFNENVDSEADFDPDPLFTHEVDVEMFGRSWKFDIWSTKSFRTANSDNQPLTILFGGIFIDTLLMLLFISISRSSNRALSLADSMTYRLEENAIVLEAKAAELEKSNAYLTRFNKTATGRELRMIELKKEVDELLDQSGRPCRYGATTLRPNQESEGRSVVSAGECQ